MAARRVWLYRLVFALLASAILFFALLPFGPGEGGVPGPELTVCLIFAWVLRRPDYVPVWLIVVMLLLDDVMLMRPLGLWTLTVLLASEYLRRRVDHAEALPFWSEVGVVSGCIVVVFTANHLTLVLLFAEPGPLLGTALHALATIVFYPPIAVFSQMIGVRRLAPGEMDSLGTRA
ncbi:rod shape-determining protein MreD [Jannaschia ovalis]|uniref:Rod shape-determining protein MreD n=1 Tax=Jannaschia ovalis TaxID=3038773 RepID=A0ABY8L8W8_9RHOB|nr:rod shape-determining protein MreD [Jannaschia sp. GRR-S6-38]WGH77801.1 rod shape-determining protein MreD [Jannaschia sp. GRR-S6-38]